ncbi:hypothetical protein BDP27DRAFT_216746 [Rhodocollybia butyracea]|uniref:Uncharacterized protein n=1 Tax=Rhodocollybia butyracea TaxID=206335 RepID=A0A9P5U2B4_9AGAR|nr:hypothetical protein BDP27DRAFT_216746 [Rhodocollybia butyracea]
MRYKSEESIIQHLNLHLKDGFFPWLLVWMPDPDIWTVMTCDGTEKMYNNLPHLPLLIGCVYLRHTNQVVAQTQLRQNLISISGWLHYTISLPGGLPLETPLVLTSHGRARCSADQFKGAIHCDITVPTFDHEYFCTVWLSQAGHVLHRLNLNYPVEAYAVSHRLFYYLRCPMYQSNHLPTLLASFTTQGYYLFLEPIKNHQS